jgi:hypothetical protein
MFKASDDGKEILKRHPPGSDDWTHENSYRHLLAGHWLGEITISMVEPTIPDTQWQGAIIQDDITATVYIDGQEAGTVDIIAGQATFDLELLPGTHAIRITAPDCQEAVLEVVV